MVFAGEALVVGEAWLCVLTDFYLKKTPPPDDEMVLRPCLRVI